MEYITQRQGGLYLSGELVMHSDIMGEAEKLDIKAPEHYDNLVQKARNLQLNAQEKMAASEIFGAMESQLNGTHLFWKEDPVENGLRLADLIINAIDDLGIFISVDSRGLLVLPRLDQKDPLTVDALAAVFQRLRNAITMNYIEYPDTVFTGIDGAELYRIFLTRISTH